MEPDETKKEQKRLYKKPKLRTIELAAEEVLGVGCKTVTGPSNVGIPTSCNATVCNLDGT